MKLSCQFAASALVFLLATVSMHAAEPASDADKTFVGKVSQGGAYEVEASRVALLRASRPDVKDLANTEVHDHSGVNVKLKQIAAATGIPIAPSLNDEFKQRLATLKGVSGPAFDQAYLDDMKSIHDKDEKLFAQEAHDGSANFRDFAHHTDQIVQRHIGALNANVTP